MTLNLTEVRNDLSMKGKNGIAFLLAASIIWTIITIIFFQPTLEIYQKNIYMLFTSGLMFPLSIAVSTLIKAEWKFKNNPLANLGLYLNLAQIIYFPILIWAIANSPNQAVLFFAIIVGAHFYPYGWFYNTKVYMIMAPIISVVILFIGWTLEDGTLWVIPCAMILFLLLTVLFLYIDYKKKRGN